MPKQWKSDDEFKPWLKQRSRGIKTLAVGIGLGALAYALPFGLWTYGLAALAFITASLGLSDLKRAANRAFGKSLEAEWSALAREMLGEPFEVETGVRVHGLGDADLVVRRKADRAVVVVEIKAFVYWKARFFGLIPGDREGRAFAQVARLGERIKADGALVWLPQGKSSFWQWLFPPKKNGVRVVFGGLPPLRKAILAIPKKETATR